MLLTMIDGKVCNALNESSSQRCLVCKETISKLNNIEDSINKQIDETTLKYGFSVFHAQIRFLELVLHISYRMEIKEWRVPTDKEHSKEAQKNRFQNRLHEELGILVDAPTQGSGNTNDGNTARRFFHNSEVVVRITGSNEELLGKFKVILSVISSGYAINKDAFKEFALGTARMYADLYDWYYMPPSMRVILLHGHKIMEELIWPIGMLSEEAQESNNTNVKKFRQGFARKISRDATNYEMFHRLLLHSDPYLSQLNQSQKKKLDKPNVDIKDLIITDNNDLDSGASDSDSEITSDSADDSGD